MEKFFIIIFILLALFGIFTFIMGCLFISAANDPDKCDCTDPNQCEKWCSAKELFTRATSYKITEECKHPNTLTQVLESFATCETTIEVCADCNEPLTEPKTECR